MPPKKPKPLNIGDILAAQLEDPALCAIANAEFQKHVIGLRANFQQPQDAVSRILSRTLEEISWFQQLPFVIDMLEPKTGDRKETWDESLARVNGAIDRLENAQVEELRERVRRAIREKLVDKLRVAIPKYIANPFLLTTQVRFSDVPDPPASGSPVRSQLRTFAEHGYQPRPIDRRTGQSMGGKTDEE